MIFFFYQCRGLILGKKSRQKSEEFSCLLFTVTSLTWPGDLYFFKLTQTLTVSVEDKGGKPDRKPYTIFPLV